MRRPPIRFVLVAAMFALSLLLYVDRACISLAKDDVTRELGLGAHQWAWVLSAFAFGYALMQTPSGMLADYLGGRIALTAVVAVWSVFTGLTATVWNFGSLVAIRALFGAGEAGAFPGMARVIFAWIPLRERGLVNGINFSGSRIGAALAMPVIAMLIAGVGWKGAFAILMLVGFGWALVWWRWFRDDPRRHPSVTAGELAFILKERETASPTASVEPLRFRTMLGSGNLWLMMTQYFCSNFTFFFTLTWLYPYMKTKYQLGAVDTGLYAMLPLLAGAVGNVCSGRLVDVLFRRGFLRSSRRIPAIIGFALAALGMVMSVSQATPVGAVLWLSVAIFGADMTLAPSWSFCIDIGGPHSGAVSGTMNMAGNLGSAITALAFAYLPETATRGNVTFFYTAAGLSCLAIACWMFANPGRKMEVAA